MQPGTPDTSFSSALPTVDGTGFTLDQTVLINAQMPDDDFVDLSYFIGDKCEREYSQSCGQERRYDTTSDFRARRKNRSERSGPRKPGLIRSQGRSLTYQHIPRGLVNSSRLRSPALWQILLFQAAIPLDDISRLPDLRFFLYTLLHHRYNERHLLLEAICWDPRIPTPQANVDGLLCLSRGHNARSEGGTAT